MKHYKWITAGLLCCIASLSFSNAIPQDNDRIQLFNCKDLRGWDTYLDRHWMMLEKVG
ncbi:MAG: hypothetical protein ACXWWC_12700 [Chitinophagaceae bacterium]